MLALLLKDLYTLKAQMKVFLFILIIFALAFQAEAGAFAVFYATLLPVTSLAYDEQSKWPQLALMLPYSIKDIVLSKYLLGWFLSFVVSMLYGLVSLLIDGGDYFLVVIFMSLALCFLALTLPLVFWLGTEKGRLLLVAVLAGIFGMIGATGYISVLYGMQEVPFGSVPAFSGVCLLGTLLFNVLSIFLSIFLYKRRLLRG
ncbi:MAG: ABC-2 transporter permease [Peptococcaceae bacterium]|jgi:ABC-2 type transport system permease protein|nr:ABC-2 transporter permease [Peptococcaceae bacterium]